MRERYAEAIFLTYGQEDMGRSLRIADSFLAVRDEELQQLRTERDALKAELAEARATIARVRHLQELTIAASCRVQAIEQAHDTLTVLDPLQHPRGGARRSEDAS